MCRCAPDLVFWRDDVFTRFLPETPAGESAWRVIAEQCDGTAAVLRSQERSILAQLRRAGLVIIHRAPAPSADVDDETLLAELMR